MTDIYQVSIGKGVNTTRAIDWDGLPKETRRFIIHYGLTQKLNDAHASIPKGDPGIEVAVDEMIDRLVAGTVEIREASGSRGDPVRKLALQMAFDYLAKDKLKAKPHSEKARALVEASDKWLELAKEELERRQAAFARMAEPTDDLVPEAVAA